MLKLVKTFIEKTHDIPLFNRTYRFIQNGVLHLFKWYILQNREIDAIYLKGGIVRGDSIFGESDIDIIIFIKPLEPVAEFKAITRIRNRVHLFTSIFKIIELVFILSERDLELLSQIGERHFIIDSTDWQHFWGMKKGVHLIRDRYPRDAMIGVLINTSMWWLIMTWEFLSSTNLNKDSLRKFYTVVLKICRLLVYGEAILNNQNLFGEDQKGFITTIEDTFLRECCFKVGTSKSATFFSPNGESHIAEAAARLLLWFNRIAKNYLGLPENNSRRHWNLSQNFKISYNIKTQTDTISQFLSQIGGGLESYLESIVFERPFFHLILRADLPLEELKNAIMRLKADVHKHKSREWDHNRILIWTRNIFCIRFSADPIRYYSLISSAWVLRGPPLEFLTKDVQRSSAAQRLINIAYMILDSKKIPLYKGTATLHKQKVVLQMLMLNRIFFATNIVPRIGYEQEEYSWIFRAEKMTEKIVILCQCDWEKDKPTPERVQSISQDYYLAINYLISHLEPFLSSSKTKELVG